MKSKYCSQLIGNRARVVGNRAQLCKQESNRGLICKRGEARVYLLGFSTRHWLNLITHSIPSVTVGYPRLPWVTHGYRDFVTQGQWECVTQGQWKQGLLLLLQAKATGGACLLAHRVNLLI